MGEIVCGSNPDEFFAELTMWYFGTHGDLHMTGPKPEPGREGLKKYDPEAFALFDDFYSGHLKITKVVHRRRRFHPEDSANTRPADSASQSATNQTPAQ